VAAKKKFATRPTPPKLHLEQAYFNGELLKLHQPAPEKGEKLLIVGSWNLGPRVSPKPSDKRPNIYFVIPGTKHAVAGTHNGNAEQTEYDDTEILSYAPDDPKEFDVYWAIVLDPDLHEEFTSEPQLILASQSTFTPGDDFSFDKIPTAGFLENFLKISSLEKLDKYRRPDGNLPRVAIITAGFAVRFSVEKPEEKTAQQPAAEH
jgi:hypothetical protein